MVRFIVSIVLLALLIASSAPAFCQGARGCYPGFCRTLPNCRPMPTVEPIRRTVQVDVPVPCTPLVCPPRVVCSRRGSMQPMACRRNSSYQPPCHTQPVQVRIDVRVRPEPCGQAQPCRRECRNFGGLGPVIAKAAAALTLPIRVLEGVFPGRHHCAAPGSWHGPAPYPHPAFQRFGPGCPPPVSRPGAFHPGPAAGFAPPYSACPPRKIRRRCPVQEGYAR
jgi:hypothetical protein